MARLDNGEVSLTTRLVYVFQRFCQSILAGDAPFTQFHRKGVVIQRCKPRRLAERKPVFRIIAARQFNLHVALAFAGVERQGV